MPDLAEVVTSGEEFVELCEVLCSHSLYIIQQTLRRRGIRFTHLLRDPEVDDPPYTPLLFSSFDRRGAGDYLTYPLTKLIVRVNLFRLLAQTPCPVPDVARWFARLAVRFGGQVEADLYQKTVYRLVQTQCIRPVLKDEYERCYALPLRALPTLSILFSTTIIKLYLAYTEQQARALVSPELVPEIETTSLSALRLLPVSGVVEYDGWGKTKEPEKDWAFHEQVEVALRLRKLRYLME